MGEYANLKSLKAYTNNAKTHNEKQLQALAASIRQFGFNNPVLIDENNEIIAEAEENWTIYDPIIGTNRKIIRHIGDLLHPVRENRETVLELQQSLGEFAFAGQYQQNPAPISGGIVKKEWLHYYNEVPNLQKIVLSWDTAGKEGSNNAYSACIVVGTEYDKSIQNARNIPFN
ncbi:MAG: hypothetical protein IJ564_02895 [Alphaproteobacteria bacterium]|nr:hypothetical protein [Alphaproteobacteria bacterium]